MKIVKNSATAGDTSPLCAEAVDRVVPESDVEELMWHVRSLIPTSVSW